MQVELHQIGVAKEFLPEQMDMQELLAAVASDIQDYQTLNGSITKKDFGKLMRTLGEKYRGKTDNKALSTAINSTLDMIGAK